MGWNSWDCYATTVTEKQFLQNAEYMRKHLLSHGWEYGVCDIQWSEPLAGTDQREYRPFAKLCMDEYSHLIPAENRFPSSAGGRGFGPIAEKIHRMGLKFGIHIMRGIPRQAVHGRTAVMGAGQLSPGPAVIGEAWHLSEHANIWGITDDFWDRWDLFKNMFRSCELWQSHVSPDCWPDCDMLPLGKIGIGFHYPQYTKFTKDEQRTLMTLWYVFRSPLMMGGVLPECNDWTLALLTNDESNGDSEKWQRPLANPPERSGSGVDQYCLRRRCQSCPF
jgi:hypothetical protein